MGKYKLTWRDIKLEDFKTYLFAMFKAFIPKKKIKTLDELEQFIQTKSAWATQVTLYNYCLLYTSPSPRDQRGSRMPSSA